MFDNWTKEDVKFWGTIFVIVLVLWIAIIYCTWYDEEKLITAYMTEYNIDRETAKRKILIDGNCGSSNQKYTVQPTVQPVIIHK